MKELIEAIETLTEEVRLLRQELRPELRKSDAIREVQRKHKQVDDAASAFVSNSKQRLEIHTM